jgi:hypothetical protein
MVGNGKVAYAKGRGPSILHPHQWEDGVLRAVLRVGNFRNNGPHLSRLLSGSLEKASVLSPSLHAIGQPCTGNGQTGYRRRGLAHMLVGCMKLVSLVRGMGNTTSRIRVKTSLQREVIPL